MNLEEYKALMMLELLLSDKDLSEYNYATVDGSGELCCFVDEPHISKVENEMWSNNDKLDNKTSDDKKYLELHFTTPNRLWREALIKL